jgi:serine/threonine protein phosphatase 1
VPSVIGEAAGERIFIIGDIHGCADEPATLLDHLERKEGLSKDKDVVIFLGDYIDRGPASNEAIELVIKFCEKFPNTRCLKGNHEDMLLDFLGYGGRLGQAFLYNGGLETIQSYGISVFSPPEEMIEAMPEAHFRFLRELESIICVDNFICAHAGLHPLRDLSAQNDSDVLWIRDDFISNTHSFNKTIVFGHTPHQEIFLHLPYKIGIDTGLVFGNKITCLEIKSGYVLQVGRDSKKVITGTIDLSKSRFGMV